MKSHRLRARALLVTVAAAVSGCATERILIDKKRGDGHTIGSLSFSGDGEKLAFSVGDWAGDVGVTESGTIRLVDSSGGNVREIDVEGCSVGNAYHLAFGSTSKRIAYAARDAIHLLRQTRSGWKDDVVTPGSVPCDDPDRAGNEIRSLAWSPDDGRIAFSTLDRQIGVVEIATGSRELIFDTTTAAQLLAWTEGGILLKDGSRIIAIDIDARQATVLAQLDSDVESVGVTRRGRIYAVDDSGLVFAIQADGSTRSVAHVEPKLRTKGRRPSEAGHWFRIGVSPRGRYLAVAEGAAQPDGKGRARLSIMRLPPRRSTAEGSDD